MKLILKKVIAFLVARDWSWKLLQSTLMLAASYAEVARYKIEPPEFGRVDSKDVEIVSQDLVVKNGPFKGMIYKGVNSIGSVIIPKLLGSYEREIQHLVEEICCKPYTTIINIGCGEGYYAVGFAIRNPNAQVFAYDIEPFAREYCAQLAQANGVDDRVFVNGICSTETLKAFPFNGKSLIFCDCEGFEKELFTPETLQYVKNTDLLIELHDCFDISISSYISNLFKETHEQIFVESVDDIKKAKSYDYPELSGMNLSEKKRFLSENRPAIMEWVFLKVSLGVA